MTCVLYMNARCVLYIVDQKNAAQERGDYDKLYKNCTMYNTPAETEPLQHGVQLANAVLLNESQRT